MTSAGTPFRSPQTSWLWLVDFPDDERALVVGGSDSLAAELSGHFGQVDLRLPGELRALEKARYACIALSEPIDSLVPPGHAAELLEECRRLLRPGGWLAAPQRNPWWYSAMLSRQRGSADVRRLTRMLERTGFQTLRRYYLQPSYVAPLHMIPSSRNAMLAHESGGRRVNPRRLLIHVGAGAVLYPATLVLAQA